MKPYFQTHSAGWLFLIAVVAFYAMEAVQFLRQRRWQSGRTRSGPRSFWVLVLAWGVIATVGLRDGSHLAPGASMGRGLAPFVLGMALLIGGCGLRWWSFAALGSQFTFNVRTSSEHPVITGGPYRLVRHPGYTGGLMALTGIGVVYANWLGLAAIVLPGLLMILWRIRIEEAALIAAAGPAYTSYAAHHKRLLPLVW